MSTLGRLAVPAAPGYPAVSRTVVKRSEGERDATGPAGLHGPVPGDRFHRLARHVDRPHAPSPRGNRGHDHGPDVHVPDYGRLHARRARRRPEARGAADGDAAPLTRLDVR